MTPFTRGSIFLCSDPHSLTDGTCVSGWMRSAAPTVLLVVCSLVRADELTSSEPSASTFTSYGGYLWSSVSAASSSASAAGISISSSISSSATYVADITGAAAYVMSASDGEWTSLEAAVSVMSGAKDGLASVARRTKKMAAKLTEISLKDLYGFMQIMYETMSALQMFLVEALKFAVCLVAIYGLTMWPMDICLPIAAVVTVAYLSWSTGWTSWFRFLHGLISSSPLSTIVTMLALKASTRTAYWLFTIPLIWFLCGHYAFAVAMLAFAAPPVALKLVPASCGPYTRTLMRKAEEHSPAVAIELVRRLSDSLSSTDGAPEAPAKATEAKLDELLVIVRKLQDQVEQLTLEQKHVSQARRRLPLGRDDGSLETRPQASVGEQDHDGEI